MGRRGVRVDQHERWAFNRLADVYGHRPGYPAPLIARLVALAGGGEVVDLGAGTGHLAIPLATQGLQVTAVEPAARMLETLRERARTDGVTVHFIHAAAEETGLPSNAFALAVIADAVHWLDPELAATELRRILRPAGVLAILELAAADTPFMREVEEAIAAANPKRRRVETGGAMQQLFAQVCGRAAVEERFEDVRPLDEEALAGLLQTYSHLAADSIRAPLTERVAAIARRHGGAVWARTIVLRWQRMDTDR